MTDLMDRIRHCIAYAPRFGGMDGTPHGLGALLDEAEAAGAGAEAQAIRDHYGIGRE